MSDDDKKATDGTADGTNILKHAGVSESDAWNVYIASHALHTICPYQDSEKSRDKQRDIIIAGLTGIAPRDGRFVKRTSPAARIRA
jgi:hypothetical protein